MSTRLVILGILRREPLHGYEIKHIIEEEMGDWTTIAFGSIYFALDKLADEGLIKKVATKQEGHRPSRSIYQITEGGQAEFLRLLREVWQNVEREYFAIDIGVSFMDALSAKEIKGYLRQRVVHLEASLEYLNAHQKEQLARPEVPELAAVVFEHTRTHAEAELAWTKTLLARLERGELT